MELSVTHGDLLEQPVEAIVNPWNRNLIPWWLLLPQGVSGAIKRRGGVGPFIELRRHGVLPLGGAVLTSAGKLPFKGIIHVASIGHLWMASEGSIRQSVRSALRIAGEHDFRSLAFPLIGAGTGGFSPEKTQALISEEVEQFGFSAKIVIVIHAKKMGGQRQLKLPASDN